MKENESDKSLTAIKSKENPIIPPIEDMIHIIRGQQVMLDNDLARLYGVETRRLNEQVKRNIERFPDDFMFQLTKEEADNLMSQFATSTWGGSRKRPFVFTENGVAMLSGVLRSATAIEVNIRIMRAFTTMRSFLANNAKVFQRLETIEHNYLILNSRLSEHDTRFEEILNKLDNKDSGLIEGFLYDGQIFDAYNLVSDLVRKADRTIILIDNYVDDRVLKILTKRKPDVSALIYTDPRNSQITHDLNRHNSQYPPIQLKRCSNVHDRFLIIDDTVYFIGGSIKDLGKKIVAFSRMHLTASDILSRLK